MSALQWTKSEFGEWAVGINCRIYLERRPGYCDRGNFLAKIFVNPGAHPIKLYLDEADGWPRYYFDEARAKAEIEAWLVKRGEMPK